MTKVKICGLRRKEDIEYVNMFKPDFAGFVFAKSKRKIDLKKAADLIGLLDKKIKRVGIFSNQSISQVISIADILNLDILQFHGDETQEYLEYFKSYTLWKTIKIKTKDDLKYFEKYKVDAILFDTLSTDSLGGTGEIFNWDIIENINFNKPIILAGGLNSNNVTSAIKRIKPYAVDVSSGVETNEFKDPDKIKLFIEKVRNFK